MSSKNLIRFVVLVHLCRIFIANVHIDRYLPSLGKMDYLFFSLFDLNKSTWNFAFFTGTHYQYKKVDFVLKDNLGDVIKRINSDNDMSALVNNPQNKIRYYSALSTFNIDSTTQNLFARSFAVKLLNQYMESYHVEMDLVTTQSHSLAEYKNNTPFRQDTLYRGVISFNP